MLSSFINEGYSVFQIPDNILNKINKIKLDTIMLFADQANCDPISFSDKEIIDMYKNNREKWVNAYDMARRNPLLNQICGSDFLLELVKNFKIELPYIGAPIVMRINMPTDPDYLFPAHQDFPISGGSYGNLTIWIPMQDVNTTEGALKVIPRSHLGGVLPYISEGRNELIIKDPPKDEDYISVELKYGQGLIFDQRLVHKSGYNNSQKILFSIQFRYDDAKNFEFISRGYKSLKREYS